MAYRKTPWRKFHPAQVLPIWTTTQTDTVTMAFQALMSKLEITDVASYFRKLRYAVGVCVMRCAPAWVPPAFGITGIASLAVWRVFLAPAALVWGLRVVLVGSR
jgi:hypothetical protein